jgi:alkylation response protein AidB-like acyl-CoA dehydrogenase
MYRLNEDQEKIVQRVRELADTHIAPNADHVDCAGEFPEQAMTALAEAGFLGLTVATEFGGMGQGPRVAAAVLDELAQRCASTAMVYLMHLCGTACYSARPDVAEGVLRDAAAGRHLTTLAWSEKGSRSHFWAPVSRAEERDGGIVLNAEKSWVTSAGRAQSYVVSTGAAGMDSPLATTLYAVDAGTDGLTISGPWDALGMRGNASAPMRLENVQIPVGNALSAHGKGFDMMLGVVLPWFQLGNSAVSVGIAEAAVQSTARHLTGKKFEHLESKLADLPNLRARLAQMRIATDRTRAHLAAVLDAVENPGDHTMLLVLESKASASETAIEVTDLGMKACGGAAFSRHLSVERNFRDARAASVMAPTADVLHDFIGRALCGMELF